MKNKFLLIILVLFLVAGCATPMVASLEKHKNHYLPILNPHKGLIYLYRESSYVGSLRGLYVDIDGKRSGALNSGTYFVYEADPGERVIVVENWLGKAPYRIVNVEAGKRYYVKAGIKAGLWDAVPYINISDKEEGRRAISDLVYATMKQKDLQKN